MAENNKNREEFDWIESVTELARLIGMNPVRVRWKLLAWQNRMKAARGNIEVKAGAITHEHKTCPKCRSINSIEDKVCYKCGAKLQSRPVEMANRFLRHFELGPSPETFIALAFLIVYGLVVKNGQYSSFSGLSSYDLIRMGGNTLMSVSDGRPQQLDISTALREHWYMLWTSVFLHGGIYHLFFNTYALVYLAPLIRDIYGSSKMVFVFFIAGIGASAASLAINVMRGSISVSIGASGAICGLIGLAIMWGHRDGTFSAKIIRNQMARWVLYTFIVGYFIGADNTAHAGGLLSGALIGLFLPTNFNRDDSPVWRYLGVLSWIAVIAGVGIIAYLSFTLPQINDLKFHGQ